MVKDAEAHADEAHRLRELADARNTAESARVPDREARSRSTATSSTSPTPRRSRAGSWSCAASLESTDVERDPRRRPTRCSEASRKLADALYAQATAQAQVAQAAGNGAATAEDEVVEDADYEVIDEEEAKTS